MDKYWEFSIDDKFIKDKYTKEQSDKLIQTLYECFDCIECEICKDCFDMVYDCIKSISLEMKNND